MKLILFILISLVILFSACNRKLPVEDEIRESLKYHMEIYPEAELADLYKFYFHGIYGPGHFVIDSVNASKYLQYELSNSERFDGPEVLYCGYDDLFVRVNLSLIVDGKADKNEFLRLFLESSDFKPEITIDEWKKEWELIYSVIKEEGYSFPNEEEHIEGIYNNLAEGYYVGHHSKKFIKKYDPHYRLMKKTAYLELIKKGS